MLRGQRGAGSPLEAPPRCCPYREVVEMASATEAENVTKNAVERCAYERYWSSC